MCAHAHTHTQVFIECICCYWEGLNVLTLDTFHVFSALKEILHFNQGWLRAGLHVSFKSNTVLHRSEGTDCAQTGDSNTWTVSDWDMKPQKNHITCPWGASFIWSYEMCFSKFWRVVWVSRICTSHVKENKAIQVICRSDLAYCL